MYGGEGVDLDALTERQQKLVLLERVLARLGLEG